MCANVARYIKMTRIKAASARRPSLYEHAFLPLWAVRLYVRTVAAGCCKLLHRSSSTWSL